MQTKYAPSAGLVVFCGDGPGEVIDVKETDVVDIRECQ